jgi:hypothetical protein
MKLALLTFHDAANYGAVLQAYALQAFLEGQGHECEYLDYRNEHRRNQYDMLHHIAASLRKGRLSEAVKYAFGMPFMGIRKRRFAEFRAACLHVGGHEWRTSAEVRSVAGDYDKFVVGSDQVWCPGNNGRDTAFLLDFVEESGRKIAYASSFGTDQVPDDMKQAYARCLAGIGRIGVRERAGCRLVKELTGREVPMVVDPVFLPGRDAWERLIPPRPASERPFVFSYTNQGGQLERFLKTSGKLMAGRTLHKLARQTRMGDFFRRGIHVKYTMSPTEFLRNVRDADLVLTASFHCLAFSLIFNKPFVCFLAGKGKDERLLGLLRQTGLENRVFHDGMTAEEALAPVAWDDVNRRLGEQIRASKEFLLDALSGEGEP